MSFLSRLFARTTASAKRRASQKRSVGLGVEHLEQRWTPAVSIVGQFTDNVVITDSDDAGVNNSIEIIDDRNTLTTYIRINGGQETQLGQGGDLLSRLRINMGAGNDNVKFTTRGANAYDGDQFRTVDLGSGDDSLTIELDPLASLNNRSLVYDVVGDTSGDDSYRLTGGAANGALVFDLSAAGETSGDDQYHFAVQATNAAVVIATRDLAGDDQYHAELFSRNNGNFAAQIELVDDAGNDSYALALSGLNLTGDSSVEIFVEDYAGSDDYAVQIKNSSNVEFLSVWLKDHGPGVNTVNVVQGNLDNVDQFVTLEFAGTLNQINVGGNAQFTGATEAHFEYVGGAGVDVVSIDDNALRVADYEIGVYTNGGNDRFALTLDGAPGLDAIDDAGFTVKADLGAGHDAFFASVGSVYRINSMTRDGYLQLLVRTGQGDDKLNFIGGEKMIAVGGAIASLNVVLDAGAGNDAIELTTGPVVVPQFPERVLFHVIAGSGADSLKFGGVLKPGSPFLKISDVGISALPKVKTLPVEPVIVV